MRRRWDRALASGSRSVHSNRHAAPAEEDEEEAAHALAASDSLTPERKDRRAPSMAETRSVTSGTAEEEDFFRCVLLPEDDPRRFLLAGLPPPPFFAAFPPPRPFPSSSSSSSSSSPSSTSSSIAKRRDTRYALPLASPFEAGHHRRAISSPISTLYSRSSFTCSDAHSLAFPMATGLLCLLSTRCFTETASSSSSSSRSSIDAPPSEPNVRPYISAARSGTSVRTHPSFGMNFPPGRVTSTASS
mmetsp:Transcript_21706/g.63849  ORF Transcript_21706/g.63849 Transcript_21706/m.63849 type:complete len:245 (-) Transcript_21706:268-1002(-)